MSIGVKTTEVLDIAHSVSRHPLVMQKPLYRATIIGFMAPNAVQKGNLKIISKYTPEEFAAAGNLVEKSVKVKQAKEDAYVYLKIGVCQDNLLGGGSH